MKKSAILLIALVLIVSVTSCARTAPVEEAPSMDSDIQEMDELDEELDTSDIDELEQDLDVEI